MRPPSPLDPHERLLLFTWRIPQSSAAVVGSVPDDDETTARLGAIAGVAGAFALGTCQRRLFILLTERDHGLASADLPARLAAALGPRANLLPPPEIFHGWAAVEHVTAVAAGLDAIVQGESEVGGQFRQAAARAERAGYMGQELTRILHRATRVARNVRRTIGHAQAPSVLPRLHEPVAAVAEDARARHGGFRAAVMGTGRMGRAAERWLRRFQPHSLYMVSRDAQRAADASAVGGVAVPLTIDAFLADLPDIDVLVTAVPTEQPVVLSEHLRAQQRPLLVCDLSLPRAVAPDVGTLPNVRLLHIEDLAEGTERHQAAHLALQVELAEWRRRALVEARQERMGRLDDALRREADDLVAAFPADAATKKEMRRRLARMRHIALEQLADAFTAGEPEKRPAFESQLAEEPA